VVVSLSSCLNALDIDAGSWGAAERLGLFGALLNLCVDQRDRVRRVAQNGVHRILRKHASLSKRSETVLTTTSVQFFENILASTTLKDSVQSVHTLSFMRLALPLLPASCIAVVLEAVLKLLALGSSKLTLLALRTVMNVVEAPSAQLSLGLLQRLASTLVQLAPNQDDPGPAAAYQYLLSAVLVRLAAAETAAGQGDAGAVTAAAAGTNVLGHLGDVGGDLAVFDKESNAPGTGAAASGGAESDASTAGAFSGLAGRPVRLHPADGLPETLLGRDGPGTPRTDAALVAALPILFKGFLSERAAVHVATANALCSLVLATITAPSVGATLSAVRAAAQAAGTALDASSAPHVAFVGFPPLGTPLPPGAAGSPTGALVACIESLMAVKFQPAWPIALPLLAVVLRHLGLAAAPLLSRVLLALVDLRASLIAATAPAADPGSVRGASAAAAAADLDDDDTQYTRGDKERGRRSGRRAPKPPKPSITLDAALGGMAGLLQRILWRIMGSALRSLGPRAFLAVVPLEPVGGASPAETAAALVEGTTTDSRLGTGIPIGIADERTWLLRLLRQHAKYVACELSLFTGTLLDAARAAEAAATAADDAGLHSNARALRSRAGRVWALFPLLCQCPSDVPTGFGAVLGRTVTGALSKADPRYPEVPAHICSAIETLITRLRLAAGLSPPVRPAYMGLVASAPGLDDDASTVGGFTVTSKWAGSVAGSVLGEGSILRGGGASVFGSGTDMWAAGRSSHRGGTRVEGASAMGYGQKGDTPGTGDLSAGAPAEARHPVLVASMGVGGHTPTLTKAEAEAGLVAVAALAGRYLPVLFNVYETVVGTVGARSSTRATRVLHAIAAYICIAPEDLVASFTARLMSRTAAALATVSSAVGEAVTAARASGLIKGSTGTVPKLNKKRLGLLAAESPAVANALTRMTALLSLSLTLVPRLTPAQAAELYRTIRPAMAESALPTQQKRSYQVLLALLTSQPAFLDTEGAKNDIVVLMRDSLFDVSASARKARLRCLEALVGAMDPLAAADREVMAGMVGEVMLCTKDANTKARAAAFTLLLTLVYALAQVPATVGALGQEVGGGVAGAAAGDDDADDDAPRTELSGGALVGTALPLVTAGLTSQLGPMVAATVHCVSRIMYEFAALPEMSAALPALLHSVLALVPAATPEVMRAIITLAKVAVVAFPPATVGPVIPAVLRGVMALPSDTLRTKTRSAVKLLVLKLHRKFGADAIAPHIPEGDAALLKGIVKAAARKGRKKNAARSAASKAMAVATGAADGGSDDEDDDAQLGGGGGGDSGSVVSAASSRGGRRGDKGAPLSFDALLAEEDADLEDRMTSASAGASSFTGVTANVPDDEDLFAVVGGGRRAERKRRGRSGAGDDAWIAEGSEEPLDLLSPTAVRNVVGTDPSKLAAWKTQAAAGAAGTQRSAAGKGGDVSVGDGITLSADGRIRIALGAGDDEDSDDSYDAPEDRVAPESADAAGMASKQGWGLKNPHQHGKGAASAAAGAAGTYSGATYRGKKAKGDVQRKGSKFEPFAYVALDPRSMSGRGGSKSIARFHDVTASTMKRGSAKRSRSAAKAVAAEAQKDVQSGASGKKRRR